MKLKALVFAAGMACATSPVFAANQVSALSAGKVIAGAAATTNADNVAALGSLERAKGALGVAGLLLSRRRLN